MTKHLDLGCGISPRNPYAADSAFGCDIRDIDFALEKIAFEYKKVNLVVDPIPYPDNFFDSVSAYDFLSMYLGNWYCLTVKWQIHSLI
jgi:hypothetical protein